MKKTNLEKKNYGITLIALVITIIVLLILAAISINAIFGENGLLVKAQLSAFATEMKQIEENVHLKQAENQLYNADGSSKEQLFTKKLNGNDVAIPDTLKQEILYVRDGMPENKNPSDYDISNFVGDIYIIDKETANGKENTYIYDETTDTAYKIPQTNIGGKIYHSYECAENGKGGQSTSGGETGQDPSDEEQEGIIEEESKEIKVGNDIYYAPNLKGFNEEQTYMVYYSADFSKTKEVQAKQYIEEGQKYQRTEEDGTYTLHNYGEKTWANMKTINNGQESWWVWIPRYAYRIKDEDESNKYTEIVYIDTNNKPLNTEKDGETLESDLIPHPAFTVDGNELKGIWISKYEASYMDSKTNNDSILQPDMTGFDREHTYIELYDTTEEKYKCGEDEILLKNADLGKANQNSNKPWYDYSNKIWANVKTDNNGQEAWWVWVPRYAYKVQDAGPNKYTDVIFIDIKNKPIDAKYGDKLPDGYIPHPAFTVDGNELKGIWISKYEASYMESKTNNDNALQPEMTGFDEEHSYIELYDKTNRNISRRSR